MSVCAANVFAVASYLSAIETDGHNAQLVGVGKETGSDSGWQRHCVFMEGCRMQYAGLFAEHKEISATRSRIADRKKKDRRKRFRDPKIPIAKSDLR
jgi:hypothetical protein